MPHTLRNHAPFGILLLCYLLLTGWLIGRVPALAAPNESLHFEYVAILLQDKWLPDPTTSTRADERHQPPVYYVTAALLSAPFPTPPLDTELPINPYFTATPSGNLNQFLGITPASLPALYAARVASMLFGLLALVSLYVAAESIAPRPLSLLIVGLVAFQPMFLFLSAAVNNDLAVTSMGALLLAVTTYLVVHQKSPQAYIVWGIVFALAMLTKANAIFLAVLLPVACGWQWRQQGFKTAVRSALAGFLPFITLWGSWLLYNHFRTQDALGLAPSLSIRSLFSLSLAEAWGIVPYLGELWRSFWLDWSPGLWGYGPSWVYALAIALFAVGLLGWLRPRPLPTPAGLLALMHLCWIALLMGLFLWVKALMVRDAGYVVAEGRWMLPALPSMAWLVGWGWVRWWPAQRLETAVWSLLIPYALLATVLVAWFLPQLYPTASRLADASHIPPTAVPAHLQYDGQIELLATEIVGDGFVVGQETAVTLYWQSLRSPTVDYTLSAQLLVYEGGAWIPIAATNTHPGLGLRPTAGWADGDVYGDTLSLVPVASETTVRQTRQAWLAVWLVDDETGERLPMTHLGQASEWPFAQPVAVRPAVPSTFAAVPRLDTAVHVADWFYLVGVQASPSAEGVGVDLLWKGEQTPPADYTIFVHLYGADGVLLAQSDSWPDGGRSPTHHWRTADYILDSHWLPVPPPPGSRLVIGVYDAATGERLRLWQEGELLPDGVFGVVISN